MLWEALALGCLQGLTEFLPISSSAHLTLLPWMLHWNSPLLNSLTFDVALHVGTLFALLLYFWRDIWKLATAWLSSWAHPKAAAPESRVAWMIILATVPAVMLGIPFEHKLETTFRDPAVIAYFLIGAGVLLAAAEYFSVKTKTLNELNFRQAFLIGCLQALALFPGVSRSGITLTAGLFLGLQREEAARFSFLLALPVVAGACVFKVKTLLHLQAGPEAAAVGLGILASALVGLACIHFLLAFLRRRSLYVFAGYRLALGVLVLWLVWHGAH